MKKVRFLRGKLAPLGLAALFLWFSWNLIVTQGEISSKRQQLAAVQAQIELQTTLNAELQRSLDNGEAAIIERYAREHGYARSNERIIVDTSGK